MGINVKLSDDLVAKARARAKAEHRSVPKQIEYWCKIARVAEENPDLPLEMIRNILDAAEEGPVDEYEFGS